MKKILDMIVNKFMVKYPETYKNKLTAIAVSLISLLYFPISFNPLALIAIGVSVALFLYPENVMDE